MCSRILLQRNRKKKANETHTQVERKRPLNEKRESTT